MSQGNIKHIKSPILWVSIAFFLLSGITLYLRDTIDTESSHLLKGLVDIKSTVISAHQISLLTMTNTDNRNSLKVEKENIKYRNLLDALKENKSSSIIIANSFSKIYFDKEFRIDEQFDHLEKLTTLYLNSSQKEKKSDLKKLALDIGNAKEKISLFEPLVTSKLNIEINKINSVETFVTYTMFTLLMIFVYLIYTYVYVPWKSQFNFLQNEKEVLDEVLKNSEIRTQTYSWELNTDDMSIIRSERLSALLSGEIKTGSILLRDELKLFSKKSRTSFLEALDIVLEQEKILDIEVHITNSGRYDNWLHYRGRYDKEKNKIIGTVKDISDVRSAEQRFLKVFNCVPHPMIMILGNSIYRMNEYAYKYFEISNRENYQDVNFTLLFPMYQHDNKASLDKINELSKQVELKGHATSDYITFKSATGESMTAKTELFKIAFNEGDALIFALSEDSMRHQFERRLIEANKKALHERRKKAEYVAHYNTIIMQLTDLVRENYSELSKNNDDFEKKLNLIFSQSERIWHENLTYVVDGRNNIILTNMKELFVELGKKWHSAALRNNVEIELELKENNNFYWLDIEKLKAAMSALVDGAIKYNLNGKIKIEAYIDDIGSRFGRFHFTLFDVSGKYDFKVLNNHNLSDKNSLFLVKEVIEFLQGRLVGEEGDTNKISFSIDIERSNRQMSYKKEVLYVGEFDDRPLDVVDIGSQFTFDDLWAHFGGDRAIIESLLKDFIDYYPVIISDMYMAIRDKDGDELESCASDLYGVISYFPYFKSIERVILLKKYGQFHKFDRAEEELYALITELKKFEKLVDNVLLNMKAA